MDPYKLKPIDANQRRVLVVDDETDVAYSFANLLEALGYHACCAYEGLAALAAAAEFRPDTVFVDIGLPDMDGYELGRRLRERFPNVRVVALSGDPTEEGQNMAKAFFDAFILKPGNLRYIEQALAR
ncbi:MAG: response regulator [Sulfurifustis sp.]